RDKDGTRSAHYIAMLNRRFIGHAGLAKQGALAALAACCATGCMIPTRVAEVSMDIPKQAVPVALHSSIDAMDDAATQARVAHMLSRPEMRAIEREMAAGLIDGTLATLGEEERARRIDAIAAKAVTGMIRGAAKDLGPMTEGMTRSAMDGALK